MNVVTLGPLAMDAARFGFVAAILAFLVITEFPGLSRAARRKRHAATRWAFPVLAAWIVGARLGFVVRNWDSFAPRPTDMIKLWQGGFDPLAGALAGAALIALAAIRHRAALLPLGLGAGAAAAVFLAIGAMTTGAAPDLPGGRFEALTGPDVVLNEIGKPVVLNLWATWCAPCRREMPMMLDLAEGTDGAAFVFANQGESVARIGRFLASEGLSADHIVRDPQMDLMSALGARGLPATLLFDRNGALVHAHTGEISRAVLERWIRQLSGDLE